MPPTQPQLTIRADATTAMGTGHVMRMLALAQAWTDVGGQARFVGHVEAQALRRRLADEGFALSDVPAAHPAPEDLAALLERSEAGQWVALDGYHFDAGYMRALRETGRRLLVLDDICDRAAYEADLYLNQNLGAEDLSPRLNPEATRLLGPRFALLRREFLAGPPEPRNIPARAKNILVTFGGADPQNATGQALEALMSLSAPDLVAKVVAGGANPHADALLAQAAALPCACELLRAVDDMPALMRWADLAVSASGSTCWELCRFGVPMLITAIADNQEGIALALAKAGAAVCVRPKAGELAKALGALLDDAPRRQSMSACGQALVDGQGARRVARAMRGMEPRLRPAGPTRDSSVELALVPAGPEDARRILRWRNSPFILRWGASRQRVTWAEHHRWYTRALSDPNMLFRIIYVAGKSAGLLRLERAGGICTLTVYLLEQYTGKGRGPYCIRQGVRLAAERWGKVTVQALVREENKPARMAFGKAGFAPSNKDDPMQEGLVKLVWSGAGVDPAACTGEEVQA